MLIFSNSFFKSKINSRFLELINSYSINFSFFDMYSAFVIILNLLLFKILNLKLEL